MRCLRLTDGILDVTHGDAPIAVESMFLKVAGPEVQEVTAMVVQRFCLSMMFDGRTTFAIDVQDDFGVQGAVQSQQQGPDVADVGPPWEAGVVGLRSHRCEQIEWLP